MRNQLRGLGELTYHEFAERVDCAGREVPRISAFGAVKDREPTTHTATTTPVSMQDFTIVPRLGSYRRRVLLLQR